jgi:hypothetical protein
MALRLRFSLGALVLSVLLVTSVAAFLWNWQEWLPVRTHTYDRRIEPIDYYGREILFRVPAIQRRRKLIARQALCRDSRRGEWQSRWHD